MSLQAEAAGLCGNLALSPVRGRQRLLFPAQLRPHLDQLLPQRLHPSLHVWEDRYQSQASMRFDASSIHHYLPPPVPELPERIPVAALSTHLDDQLWFALKIRHEIVSILETQLLKGLPGFLFALAQLLATFLAARASES